MLDLRSPTGLPAIGFLVSGGQRAVSVGLFAGEVLCVRRIDLQPLTLLLASVGAVAVEAGLFTMQQVWYLVAVMDWQP